MCACDESRPKTPEENFASKKRWQQYFVVWFCATALAFAIIRVSQAILL